MRHVLQEGSLPPCGGGVVHFGLFLIHQFGTPQPSLRQTVPHRLVLGTAREFRHDLAFGGKSQESVSRVHFANLRRYVGKPTLAEVFRPAKGSRRRRLILYHTRTRFRLIPT
jgi:hypothetical protein